MEVEPEGGGGGVGRVPAAPLPEGAAGTAPVCPEQGVFHMVTQFERLVGVLTGEIPLEDALEDALEDEDELDDALEDELDERPRQRRRWSDGLEEDEPCEDCP